MRITFYESTRYLLRCHLPQKPDFFQLSQWPHFKNIWLLIINLNKNSIYKQHRIPLIMYATCQDCQGKKVSTNTWMFWCVWRQHGVLKRVDVRDDLVICPAYFFFELLFPCAEETLMCCLLKCSTHCTCIIAQVYMRVSRSGLLVSGDFQSLKRKPSL